MRLFRAIETSASGLTAERLRMDIIANNIANANSTRTAEGGPYRRQVAIFGPRGASNFATVFGRSLDGDASIGSGVRVLGIRQDPSPPKIKYDPSHPDADEQGYVRLPNVNVVTEMVDLISASRAYEANITAMNSAKAMAIKALEIGRG